MTIQRKLRTCLLSIFTFCIAVSAARAEVTQFEVKSRTDVPGYNYEIVIGRIHFAVDPRNPHNAVIVDLDKAQRDAGGKVSFSADLYMLRPKSGSSDTALIAKPSARRSPTRVSVILHGCAELPRWD
jgi:hypothetical protein